MKDVSGERFDQYYIVKRVDEGIEGDLYTAYDTNPPERAVSLLLVGETFARQPEFKHRFQQAMDRSQQLNDPSLLRILNHGVWSKVDTCYVISEDPQGYTLRQILGELNDQQQVLKLTDVVEIVREVCTAIELVRLNYLPVRDLSPDNILENIKVTWATSTSLQEVERSTLSNLRIFVTDLGLGRIVDSPLSDNTRSEIYALGALLYRLVLGEDQKRQPSRAGHLVPPRILNPALPRSIERIILTALASNPRERYDNPGLMAIDLTNAHWEAQQYDINAPHRELAIDLSQWLLRKGAALGNVEYAQLEEELLLPAVISEGLDVNRPRNTDVRLETLTYSVDVAPGGRAEAVLQLENISKRDRRCWIRIDSKPEYISIDSIPASVGLGAAGKVDSEKKCRLVFQPSLSPLCPAGLYRIPIAIIYNQSNIWIDSDTIEIVLRVARIQNCTIDVWPRTLETGQLGQVIVANRGNTSESLLLSLTEPLGKLDFNVEDANTDRAVIILDSGESAQIAFSPKLRQPHWWGKDRLYPFKIEIITPEQKRLETTECQAVSRRRIPLWPILFSIISCLLLVFVGLWLFRPSVEAVDCLENIVVSQPSVALCIKSYTTVNSLSVFPGDVPLNLDSGQLILPAPAPDEPQNTIRLEAHNAVSRILPFLAYRKNFNLLVRKPQPTLAPAPKLLQFCVGDADHPEINLVCSTQDKVQSLSLMRGQAQTLFFTWQTENVTVEQVELLPRTIPFEISGSNATAPMPVSPITYTLNLVDAMGTRLEPLSISVAIQEVRASVREPVLYLRKSPGQVYESIALLAQGTEVILLTQPLDYQQNEDNLHWVKVVVAATNETGWTAMEGLSSYAGVANGNAGGASVDGVASPAGGATSSENAEGNGNPNVNASAGDATSVGGNGGVIGNLPAVLPEFGPTVTPTPTPTATETPTPQPTATPVPTRAPLIANVEIVPTVISNCEDIEVRWNIEGVKEVYFDFGRGPFDLMLDNRLRSEKLRHGIDFGFKDKPENEEEVETILFRWKIILDDGAERILAETLHVEKKPLPPNEKDPCRLIPDQDDDSS